MGRVVVLTLVTLLVIFLLYKRDENIKKALISIALFGYILTMGYSGYILTKSIRVIFFIHILSLIASYLALIYYIFKNRLYWKIFILPIVTMGSYFILNYIDGARYEA